MPAWQWPAGTGPEMLWSLCRAWSMNRSELPPSRVDFEGALFTIAGTIHRCVLVEGAVNGEPRFELFEGSKFEQHLGAALKLKPRLCEARWLADEIAGTGARYVELDGDYFQTEYFEPVVGMIARAGAERVEILAAPGLTKRKEELFFRAVQEGTGARMFGTVAAIRNDNDEDWDTFDLGKAWRAEYAYRVEAEALRAEFEAAVKL